MTVRIWEVGGHVRDSLRGIESKDIDMAVEAPSFEAMIKHVEKNTKKIIRDGNGEIIGAEHFTIRAVGFDGLGKDFVFCRIEGPYSDGRHPDWVKPGTLLDDLARRDFTINAIARDPETGEIVDPFDGKMDLALKILKCVGSTEERFDEDALRIIRAFRFWVRGFQPNGEIHDILCNFTDTRWGDKVRSIKRDRVREEMMKCFKEDTLTSMRNFALLNPDMQDAILGNDLWLKPTTEKR